MITIDYFRQDKLFCNKCNINSQQTQFTDPLPIPSLHQAGERYTQTQPNTYIKYT